MNSMALQVYVLPIAIGYVNNSLSGNRTGEFLNSRGSNKLIRIFLNRKEVLFQIQNTDSRMMEISGEGLCECSYFTIFGDDSSCSVFVCAMGLFTNLRREIVILLGILKRMTTVRLLLKI